MNPEEKLFVPHGVQSVPVDGLCAEVAAVQGHAQDVDFDARAPRAAVWTHVLTRDDLRERKGSKSPKMSKEQSNLYASSLPSKTTWNTLG